MRPRRKPLLLPVLLLAACGRPAAAQPASAPAPGGFVPLIDKSIGFDLQAPLGWNYDRTGFFGPGGSSGVLRGASPDGQATLQVLVFRDESAADFDAWVEYFGRQLAAVTGVRQVRIEPQRAAARPTAVVDAPATIGADRVRTLYHCTRIDSDTVWVLSYSAVVGRGGTLSAPPDPDTAAPLELPPAFQQMTSSLRVLYDPAVAAQVREALERGRAYVNRFQLQEDIREIRIDERSRIYLIRVSGRPVGYLTRQFRRESEPLEAARGAARPREGLRVQERIWQFADDGAARFARVDLFSRLDGNTDLLEFRETRYPAAGAADARPVSTHDKCVREGDALFSSYVTSLDQVLPDPRPPIKLDASYLGLAWARALPALLGGGEQPAIAFSVYDSEMRALLPYSIRPLGRRPLPGGGAEALAFETREGVLPSTATLHTDEQGHMLRLESGELVIELTDEATVEAQFRAKRDDALQRAETTPSAPQPQRTPPP